MGYMELYRVTLGYTGLKWVKMGEMGLTGLHWVTMGYTGL